MTKHFGVCPRGFYPAGWFSRLERRPVTPEVEGSSPFPVATYFFRSKSAAVAQSVERILGKDEVTSSNLVSSSMRNPETAMVSGFFFSSAVCRKNPAGLSFGSARRVVCFV